MEPELSVFGEVREAGHVRENLAANDTTNPFHLLRATSFFLSVQGIPTKFPVFEIKELDGPFSRSFPCGVPHDGHAKKVELQSRPATYAGIAEDVNLV